MGGKTNMNYEMELLNARNDLRRLLNTSDVPELSDAILERIKDIVYIVDRTIYTVAVDTDAKVRKVLQPIYNFLKSFHGELNEAIKNPSYAIKCIEEPELPDFSDFDKTEKSVLQSVVDTIINTLPTIASLISSLKSTTYPYEREINIIFNTINDFCRKLSV